MNERKATKRALLTSITALVMCVVMLAGTTFAWFTDTASTNVNKIQAGKLKVGIVDASGVSLENQTLMWVKSTSAPTGQAILWEPGATYELQPFYVRNEGNLAIRYEIKITGTQGDAKLLEAIEFYVNDATTPLTSDSIGTGTLMPKDETGCISGAITIKGHMKESAKNEYQGLSLDGIAITVYATQATYEYDSSSNTYDDGAFAALADLYPVSKSVAITKDANGNKQEAVISDEDTSGNKTYSVTVPTTAMADDADNISVTISKAASVDTANFSVTTTGNKLEQFNVTVSGIKNNNTEEITVELFIGKGYSFTNNKVTVQHLKKDGKVDKLGGSYNEGTGCVTFTTTSFSPFAVEVPDMAAAIGTGYELTYYNTLPDAVAAAKDGDTITLLKDSTENGVKVENKGFVLDLNGHTLKIGNPLVGSTGTETNGFQLNSSAGNVTFKNGTLTTEEAYILIQNYCNLTLDNMVLDGRNIPLHVKYPNSVVRYTLSNNCGEVTINNSVIYAPEKLGVAFDVYGGFGSYDDVTVTVDGNSVINGNVELTRYETKPDNKEVNNTLELKNCTINGNIKKSSGLVKLMGNITLNGNIDVTAAVNVREDQIRVADKTVLNLNGKINTPAGMGNYTNKADPSNSNFAAIYVEDSLTINAEGENGIYASTDNGSFAFAVMGRIWPDLTINGGTYHGYGTVAETNGQTITINGGNFSVTPFTSGGSNYLLNKVDSSNAEIIVKGGTFVNYDPSSSASENPVANFVADGYEVVSAKQSNGDTWYTVVKSTQTIT